MHFEQFCYVYGGFRTSTTTILYLVSSSKVKNFNLSFLFFNKKMLQRYLSSKEKYLLNYSRVFMF